MARESLDDPSRKSVQGLVPESQRGRVSAFLDSYVYATGTIVGCLVLGACVWLGKMGVVGTVTVVILHQAFSAAMAAVALFFAVKVRAVYEESLWNPMLARRRRRSVSMDLEL